MSRNKRKKLYSDLAEYQKVKWVLGDEKMRQCLGFPEANPDCSIEFMTLKHERVCSTCKEYGRGLAEAGTYEPPRKAIMHPLRGSQRAFESDGSDNSRERQLRF